MGTAQTQPSCWGFWGRTPYGGAAAAFPEKSPACTSGNVVRHGEKNVRFSPSRDLDLSHYQPLRLHPNGMQFTAVNQDGDPVEDAVFYSTGGGFVSSEQELSHPEERDGKPFLFLMNPRRNCCTWLMSADALFPPLSWRTNAPCSPEREVREKLDLIWATMKQSISNGMSARGNLPGVLQVPRRAKTLRKNLLVHGESALKDPLSIMDWINLYAIAVSEENAAGGRIVTAPTNGAAGIVPAVLNYATKFCVSPYPDAVHRFLLTAGESPPVQEKRLHFGRGRRLQGEVA